MEITKKEKLIRKHLGLKTPDWIVKNCIELLKEYNKINKPCDDCTFNFIKKGGGFEDLGDYYE